MEIRINVLNLNILDFVNTQHSKDKLVHSYTFQDYSRLKFFRDDKDSWYEP